MVKKPKSLNTFDDFKILMIREQIRKAKLVRLLSFYSLTSKEITLIKQEIRDINQNLTKTSNTYYKNNNMEEKNYGL